MRSYGVEEKFIKVCEWFNSEVETRIVMNGMKSKWFGIERCLRHGSLFLLFCLIFI